MLPKYLLEFADRITEKEHFARFYLRCSCGKTEFFTLKSKNEKADNVFDKYWDSKKIPILSINHNTDKNGEGYWYGKTFFGIHIGKFYDKDIHHLPMQTNVLKVKCASCGREIDVFDEAANGYNAEIEKSNAIDKHNNVEFVKSKDRSEIMVEIRYDISEAEFFEENKNAGLDYSNAFSCISVHKVANGKKKRIFDEETA